MLICWVVVFDCVYRVVMFFLIRLGVFGIVCVMCLVLSFVVMVVRDILVMIESILVFGLIYFEICGVRLLNICGFIVMISYFVVCGFGLMMIFLVIF